MKETSPCFSIIMNIQIQPLFFNHNEYKCRKPSNQPLKKNGERERTRESGNQVMVTLIKGELLSWGGGQRTERVRVRVG